MSALPFMPLYVADYMSDAAHLTTVEHGAYLLLLMTYWQRGEALPADDKKLARICRLGPREWKRIKPAISEFFEVGCSTWLHSRVERELSAVRAKSLKKRKAGLARAKQMHSTCSAHAQLTDTDTDIVPLSNDKGAAPVNSDREFWANSKSYLAEHGQKNPGGLIGKWVKEFGNAKVAQALTAAQVERAVEPVPYIVAVLRKSKGNADDEFAVHGYC